MTSQYQSRISSLEREIASIDKQIANENKKEADLLTKITKAKDTANRSNTNS